MVVCLLCHPDKDPDGGRISRGRHRKGSNTHIYAPRHTNYSNNNRYYTRRDEDTNSRPNRDDQHHVIIVTAAIIIIDIQGLLLQVKIKIQHITINKGLILYQYIPKANQQDREEIEIFLSH